MGLGNIFRNLLFGSSRCEQTNYGCFKDAQGNFRDIDENYIQFQFPMCNTNNEHCGLLKDKTFKVAIKVAICIITGIIVTIAVFLISSFILGIGLELGWKVVCIKNKIRYEAFIKVFLKFLKAKMTNQVYVHDLNMFFPNNKSGFWNGAMLLHLNDKGSLFLKKILTEINFKTGDFRTLTEYFNPIHYNNGPIRMTNFINKNTFILLSSRDFDKIFRMFLINGLCSGGISVAAGSMMTVLLGTEFFIRNREKEKNKDTDEHTGISFENSEIIEENSIIEKEPETNSSNGIVNAIIVG